MKKIFIVVTAEDTKELTGRIDSSEEFTTYLTKEEAIREMSEGEILLEVNIVKAFKLKNSVEEIKL